MIFKGLKLNGDPWELLSTKQLIKDNKPSLDNLIGILSKNVLPFDYTLNIGKTADYILYIYIKIMNGKLKNGYFGSTIFVQDNILYFNELSRKEYYITNNSINDFIYNLYYLYISNIHGKFPIVEIYKINNNYIIISSDNNMRRFIKNDLNGFIKDR